MAARSGVWFKSSRSGPNCDNCVEVNYLGVVPGMAAVRDTKDRQGPMLVLPVGAVVGFARAAAQGRLRPVS